MCLITKIVHAVSIPRNMLPEAELLLFRISSSEKLSPSAFVIMTSVIENVAAVPVFVAKPRAKFLTVQKLDKH